MPERLIGAVLKTVVRASVPWVRIPPPPPFVSGRRFLGDWKFQFKMRVREIADKSLIRNIIPNYVGRRFDILYDGNYKLLSVDDNFLIPMKIVKNNAYLSVDLVDMPQDAFDVLIDYVFSNYKEIAKIRISASLNNTKRPSDLSKHEEYQTVLPEMQEIFLKNLSSKIRYNYGYQQRRLIKAFGSCEMLCCEEISEDLVKKYFELKHLSYGVKYSMSPQEYLKKYHVNQAFELRVNGQTAAIIFNSIIDENVFVENISYDLKYSKYSPGTILIIFMLLSLIDNKDLKNIYWGAYNEYKKHFSNKEYIAYSGKIYRSMVICWIDKLGKFIFSSKKAPKYKIIRIMGIEIQIPR